MFHNHKVEHSPLQQYLAVSKFLLLLFQHLLGSSTDLWIKVMSSACHAYDESLVAVLHYSLSDYILQYNHRKEECKDISLQNSSFFSFLWVSTLRLIFRYVILMAVTNSSVTRNSIRFEYLKQFSFVSMFTIKHFTKIQNTFDFTPSMI